MSSIKANEILINQVKNSNQQSDEDQELENQLKKAKNLQKQYQKMLSTVNSQIMTLESQIELKQIQKLQEQQQKEKMSKEEKEEQAKQFIKKMESERKLIEKFRIKKLIKNSMILDQREIKLMDEEFQRHQDQKIERKIGAYERIEKQNQRKEEVQVKQKQAQSFVYNLQKIQPRLLDDYMFQLELDQQNLSKVLNTEFSQSYSQPVLKKFDKKRASANQESKYERNLFVYQSHENHHQLLSQKFSTPNLAQNKSKQLQSNHNSIGQIFLTQQNNDNEFKKKYKTNQISKIYQRDMNFQNIMSILDGVQ